MPEHDVHVSGRGNFPITVLFSSFKEKCRLFMRLYNVAGSFSLFRQKCVTPRVLIGFSQYFSSPFHSSYGPIV